MGGGRNPSVRAEVLCRISLGVCVTVIKKPLTPRGRNDRGMRRGMRNKRPPARLEMLVACMRYLRPHLFATDVVPPPTVALQSRVRCAGGNTWTIETGPIGGN